MYICRDLADWSFDMTVKHGGTGKPMIKMLKKLILAALVLPAVLLIPSAAAFAAPGGWQQEAYSGRWRWVMAGGYYYFDCWQWLDGNHDGICECYYFDPEGYCLQNTKTPDGYYVNADGAWIVNGVVQTKTTAQLQALANNTSYAGVFGDEHGEVTVTITEIGGGRYQVKVDFFWALLTDHSVGYVSSDKKLYFRGTDSAGEELYGAFCREDQKNTYQLNVAYSDWNHIIPHDTIKKLRRKG